MAPAMTADRFGNEHAPGLPYARGAIVTSMQADLRKLARAHRIIERIVRDRGQQGVFNFTGLERSFQLDAADLVFADDEIAPALYGDRLLAAGLQHLGGTAATHEVALFNRLTAATVATHLTLVKPGEVVVGVSPSYSHPTVVRAAAAAGARFVETTGVRQFADALAREPRVALVALTRLAVTYDILSADDLKTIVTLARDKGVVIYVDDAGGARVGPAVFGQPRTLDLGVDVGATGLDKYGTVGPRLGLLAGDKSLVGRIRARAIELGLEARPMLYPAAVRSLEQYDPARVRALVESTRTVAHALRRLLGARLHETPVTAQLRGEDTLELALEQTGSTTTSVVPVEATAALAMLLLEDHGIVTVHFAGLPPGTSSLLFKFMPPETVTRFGGPDAFARAVAASLGKLGSYVADPERLRELLLGRDDAA
jgi:L-seryl-tRNA(Ser) seleniumtransferase